MHSVPQKLVCVYAIRLSPGVCDQLGSLGGGNHFTEMQVDGDGHVWVMLHTGSRGFGWNIAKQFFVEGAARLKLEGKKGKGEDYVWFDADSAQGKDYWNLHNMAANFAVANRLAIDLAQTRQDYLDKGYFVSIVDQNGHEVHRESIDSAEKSG